MTIAQAESLEAGDAGAFDSSDEMLGAAVVYGASLGISRDEALALLRRSMHVAVAPVDVAGPYATVKVAGQPAVAETITDDVEHQPVQVAATPPRRSLGTTHATTAARIGVGSMDTDPVFADITAANTEASTVWSSEFDAEQTGEIPLAPLLAGIHDDEQWEEPSYGLHHTEGLLAGASDDTATTVLAARELDPEFAAAMDTGAGELDAWAGTHGGEVAVADGVQASRIGHLIRTRGARMLGPERAHTWATGVDRWMYEMRETVAGSREWLERSRYGTLVAGVAVGVLLMATMYGVVTLVKGSDTPFPEAKTAATQAVADKSADTAKPKQAPVKARSKLTIDVLNAGAVKGRAAQRATVLDNKGYKVRDVGNSSTLYATPIILYAPNHRREAVRLGKDTGITTLDKLQSLTAGYVNMIVVVK
uniref:LytR/CpsA/Psr regulator C-terminal domain-containing protein n=1 Tax=uncultured bacterium W5-102b TaxID=1130996 RepID=H9BWJ7_9BACT|nr:hypothetical protein [uncultured bacterium W5-102b]